MILSESQVIKKVQSPSNKEYVLEGLRYESRLKVFTEVLFAREASRETGYTEILNIMGQQLHPDKVNRTKDFFQFPLPIVNLSNDILGDIYKVFDGRNANFNVFYDSKRLEERGTEVLAQINTRTYIEHEGKKVLKNRPNTFTVVDKKEDGTPYLISVDNSILKGFTEDSTGKVTSITFLHSVSKTDKGQTIENIAYYDDTHYRVVQNIGGKYTLVTDNAHNLGYCPAHPFISTKLNSKSILDKYNPISPVLADMCEWTLNDVYNRYCSKYNSYPVVEQAKPACEVENCKSGTLEIPVQDGGYTYKDCPSCSKSKLLGPGTVINVDPAQFQDEKDVSGMFRFVNPPIDNLKHEQEQQYIRANTIKKNTTGVSYVMEKEAVNADQVRSIMEDRRKPLLFIAMQLNKLHKWIVKTVIKLDLDIDVKVHANYGTEWFLLTESQIQKLFQDAKTAGMPDSELDELYSLLVETKYKGNPETINKLIIENNLNPAPYSNQDESIKKYDVGVMSKDDLAIKLNFTRLIKRFERENGSLAMFGKDAIMQGRMTFDQKIDTIYNELLNYVKQDEQNNQSEQVQQQGDTTDDS